MINIKEWLNNCDILKDKKIESGYLGPDINSNFSLEENAVSNPVISRNVLYTKTTRRKEYTLSGRFSFDKNNTEINEENMQFMQKITEWIIEQDLKHNYPKMAEDEERLKINILSSPSLDGLDKSLTYSKYSIKFEITYEKREENEHIRW